jgi:hypothetical protein
LRGHGGQELKIIGRIAAGLGSKIDSSDQLAGTDQVESI